MQILSVPFLEKDAAKKLGARWDPVAKLWYVPKHLDIAQFKRWLPDGVVSDDIEDSTEAGQIYSLGEFLAKLEIAVAKEFVTEYLITVEVAEHRIYKGHSFFKFIEYDDNGKKIAEIDARLWASAASAILSNFAKVTGDDITKGMLLLISATLDYNKAYGLTLNITNIDPKYTVGVMAAKVAAIKQKLVENGIAKNNSKLKLPIDYTSVAVISPNEAAGLGDFKFEANLLADNNLCCFTYYSAVFQGGNASASIREAIALVEKDNLEQNFDVVVIIRGGGAAPDLACLNEYDLAAAICKCSLPVFVGIGHERDSTVLDFVANRSFGTPSKVISYFITTITDTCSSFYNLWQDVVIHCENKIEMHKKQLEFYITNTYYMSNELLQALSQQLEHMLKYIPLIATTKLSEIKAQLEQQRTDVYAEVKNSISNKEKDLITIFKSILGFDPNKILSQGYALVSSEHGKWLKNGSSIQKNQNLQLRFCDSKFDIKVASKT